MLLNTLVGWTPGPNNAIRGKACNGKKPDRVNAFHLRRLHIPVFTWLAGYFCSRMGVVSTGRELYDSGGFAFIL